MKRILVALAAALLSTQALAQTQFPASTLWGNFTGSSGLPTAVPVPNCPAGALNFTAGTGLGCAIIGGGGGSTLPHTHFFVGNSSNVAADYGSNLTVTDNGSLILNVSGNVGLQSSQFVSGAIGASNAANFFSIDDRATGTLIDGFQILQVMNSSANTGSRQTLDTILELNFPTSPTNPNRYYVSAKFQATALSNDGGTLGAEKGALFGLNPFVTLTGAATNMVEASGGEVDMEVRTGASVLHKYGWKIVQTSNDAVSGSSNDAALVMNNGAGAIGWTNGIQFGDASNPPPVKTTGTLIASKGAATTAHGIDFSTMTFTSDAFKSNGFVVDGTGNIIAAGGAWSTFTPTIVCGAGTIAGYSFQDGHYKRIGKTVFFTMSIQGSGAGTCSGTYSVTLPPSLVVASVATFPIMDQTSAAHFNTVSGAGSPTTKVTSTSNLPPTLTDLLTISGAYETP